MPKPQPKPSKGTTKRKRPGKPSRTLKIEGTFLELIDRAVKTRKPPGGRSKAGK
jgi:hypothetical protein